MQKLVPVGLLVFALLHPRRTRPRSAKRSTSSTASPATARSCAAPARIPDLRDLGANDREKFDKMVMEGRGQMPAWQGIVSPQELDQLWAYVRSRAR